MGSDKEKVGIITFHASYNCGSMLQAYALQCFLKKHGYDPEIVDFSSPGQRRLYSVFSRKKSVKNIARNAVFLCHKCRIEKNFARYEKFKQEQFCLSDYQAEQRSELKDHYYAVIAGADQIWNITIADYDDAYFLPWVTQAKRIAYAPSFGSKNIVDHTDDLEKFKNYLIAFDSLSIRENNGRKWIAEMTGLDAPVVLDPTLLLDPEDYAPILSEELKLPEKYIFYYSPTYSLDRNRLVRKISKKYKLPVIAFNTKAFYLRGMNFHGFKLPAAEDPTTYLQLMKNATMVITTSFHGSVFASMFRRSFWIIKNGGMYSQDDRVITFLQATGLGGRLVEPVFDDSFNYLSLPDYEEHARKLEVLQKTSTDYLLSALKDEHETDK